MLQLVSPVWPCFQLDPPSSSFEPLCDIILIVFAHIHKCIFFFGLRVCATFDFSPEAPFTFVKPSSFQCVLRFDLKREFMYYMSYCKGV